MLATALGSDVKCYEIKTTITNVIIIINLRAKV